MTTPLFMRDVSLTITLLDPAPGTPAEFNCDAHTVEVVPTPGDVVSYQTLCTEGSYSNRGKSTYALHIVAAQDWSATGLARLLWEHDGERANVQYQAHGADALPPTADTPGMEGIVTLVAPTYGGEADTFAELEVEFPYESKPTLAVAAFPAADGEAVVEDAA